MKIPALLEHFFTKQNAYDVFDVETTRIGDKSIYVDTPKFILGVNISKGTPEDREYTAHTPTVMQAFLADTLAHGGVIVGHNLVFDLLVTDIDWTKVNPKTVFWDTAIAEYEMSGQADKFPSLEDLAKKYHLGYTKESTVSEMIKSGVPTEDIPQDLLRDYCAIDVKLTRDIYLKQLTRFNRLTTQQQALILERMKWRINTHKMSLNGMFMDNEYLNTTTSILSKQVEDLSDELLYIMVVALPYMASDDVNPNSNQQLATVLYGGEYKYDAHEEIGVYKTGPNAGKPKYKRVEKTQEIPGLFPHLKGSTKVDEATLKKLPKNYFVETLLKYRELSKELNTYFIGYKEAGEDFGSHTWVSGEYKHVITPTGRISSNKPNLQNLKSDD